MDTDPNYTALSTALFGYALTRSAELAQPGHKLAHYTTAENALKIITGQTIWLRSAAVMNDHSEIEHGRGILDACLEAPVGQRFASILDRGHGGLSKKVRTHVGNHGRQLRSRVFMTSLSEHYKNDRLGRLSMWRAYGGTTSGAAIIFNTEVFNDGQGVLSSHASPVLYGNIEEFLPQFEAVVQRLEENPQLLQGVSADTAFNAVAAVLDFAILSTKHLGFAEEKEWRVIHRPFEFASAHVIEKVSTIRGTPQLIYELPLVDMPGMNMPSLNIDKLIHHVIIGPSQYPDTAWQAIVEALRSNNVTEPEARVSVSEIPLRQWG